MILFSPLAFTGNVVVFWTLRDTGLELTKTVNYVIQILLARFCIWMVVKPNKYDYRGFNVVYWKSWGLCKYTGLEQNALLDRKIKYCFQADFQADSKNVNLSTQLWESGNRLDYYLLSLVIIQFRLWCLPSRRFKNCRELCYIYNNGR